MDTSRSALQRSMGTRPSLDGDEHIEHIRSLLQDLDAKRDLMPAARSESTSREALTQRLSANQKFVQDHSDQQFRNMQLELSKHKEASSRLQHDLERERKTLDEAEETECTLERQIEERDLALATLRGQLVEKEKGSVKASQEMRESTQTLQEKCNQQSLLAAETTGKLAEAQNSLDNSLKTEKHLRRQLEERQRDITRLGAQLQERDNAFKKLESMASQKEQELRQICEDQAVLKDRLSSAQESLNAVTHQAHQAAQKNEERLTEKDVQLADAHLDKQKEIANLQAEVRAKDALLEAAKTEKNGVMSSCNASILAKDKLIQELMTELGGLRALKNIHTERKSINSPKVINQPVGLHADPFVSGHMHHNYDSTTDSAGYVISSGRDVSDAEGMLQYLSPSYMTVLLTFSAFHQDLLPPNSTNTDAASPLTRQENTADVASDLRTATRPTEHSRLTEGRNRKRKKSLVSELDGLHRTCAKPG